MTDNIGKKVAVGGIVDSTPTVIVVGNYYERTLMQKVLDALAEENIECHSLDSIYQIVLDNDTIHIQPDSIQTRNRPDGWYREVFANCKPKY